MNKYSTLILAAALSAAPAFAQVRVEVVGVGGNQIPIAVAALADEGVAQDKVSAIVKADLERSGVFRVIDAGMPIAETASVDYGAWKSRGADALVVGSVQQTADGQYTVRYKLLDTVKAGEVSGNIQTARPNQMRLAAHKIADDIYEKLTGVRGIFSTRITYVKENRAARDYRLEVADADGEGALLAAHSRESIISPAWSPDGSKVAYVSFEDRKPVIYVQDLMTGQRRVVVNEKGSNSAPAWSPDGGRLAVALSKDGHTQIYGVNIDGSGLRRLSNSNGIDTEPNFSPDGQWIYFLSDRGGNPQIYKMPASGGNATRVTFNGGYNISPRISPDGKNMAWIGQRGGVFQLFIMDLESGQEQKLADNATEPSFAPNGKYVMFATESGGRKTLGVVSTDGRVKQMLSANAGSIKEPKWGPFMK